ncbi:MAG: OsmC family protein [Candidatus Omnitrophica bacterium]|nr:OsmC family protein [Candidatus Omnitrophota bacterium]
MYSVEIKNQGDSVFQVKSKDYEFNVDTRGKGITPPDALLASLGTCIGVYIRKYADGAMLPVKEFNVSVKAEFTKELPTCFRDIEIIVDLKGFELDDRRRNSMLEFVKNCPVHNTLKVNPRVEIKIQ